MADLETLTMNPEQLRFKNMAKEIIIFYCPATSQYETTKRMKQESYFCKKIILLLFWDHLVLGRSPFIINWWSGFSEQMHGSCSQCPRTWMLPDCDIDTEVEWTPLLVTAPLASMKKCVGHVHPCHRGRDFASTRLAL